MGQGDPHCSGMGIGRSIGSCNVHLCVLMLGGQEEKDSFFLGSSWGSTIRRSRMLVVCLVTPFEESNDPTKRKLTGIQCPEFVENT